MMLPPADQDQALRLLEWQSRATERKRLDRYYASVPIPGAPVDEADPDNEIFYPEYLQPAAHHRLTLSLLQDIMEGRIKRAMVFMPPGSAKSTLGSIVFPTAYLGRYPRRNLICCSYNSNLASLFGRRCRQLVRSEEFRQIYDTTLRQDSTAADAWTLSNESTYNAFGLLSGVTGRRAHGVIIDDPLKGRDAAESPTQRDKVWETYLSDVTTRLFPGGFILWMLTRWHEDDPVGRILPDDWDGGTGWVQGKDGENWFVLSLEAECTRDDDPLGRIKGEFLWTEWFSGDYWPATKRRQSLRNWSALFQQTPTPDSGVYFTREMIEWYDWDETLPNRGAPSRLTFYGSSDYATIDGEGDYTVHGVAGVDVNDNLWLVDWWRAQATTNVWIEQLMTMVRLWRPALWGEEKGQIRNSIDPFLRRRMQEEKLYWPRRGFAPTASKLARSQAIRGRMEQHKVYLPRNAPWTAELVKELLRFTGVSGNVDDQVDVLSLFGLMLDDLRPEDRDPPKTPGTGQQPIIGTTTVGEVMSAHIERRRREREEYD
jgi:predicted phage terminase large subunit-like protein